MPACACSRVSWRNWEHGHICLSVQLPSRLVFPDLQQGMNLQGCGICWVSGSWLGGVRQGAPNPIAAGVGAVMGAAPLPAQAGAVLPVLLQPELLAPECV